MPDSERKSSDDLIRDANQRFRAPQPDPKSEVEAQRRDNVEPPPVDPSRYSSDHDVVTDEPTAGPVEARPRFRSALLVNLIRWGLAFLVFGGWFLFTRIDDASRDDTGEIVDSGDLDVMSMQVGDCFDDPEEDDEVVVDVAAVPCSQPHDNEVFAVQSVAAAFPGDAFPGQDALWEYSYEVCSGALFDSYVGTSYLDSSLEVFSFTPTQESWDEGDRGFVCALYRLDLGQLAGTARDSEL